MMRLCSGAGRCHAALPCARSARKRGSAGKPHPLGLIRRDGGDAALLAGDPWRDAVALHRRRDTLLTAAGKTDLLSSQILTEVEVRCDRVTIVRAGRATKTGALAIHRHIPSPRSAIAVTSNTEPM